MSLEHAIMINEDVDVGSRISFKGSIGTVKWKGAIPDKSGLWLGVDWDDEDKGKHNGIYNGVNYFQTRRPTSGSFVAIHKIDSTQSCSSALINKFNNDHGELFDTLESLKKHTSASLVEFVGLEKVTKLQSNLSNIRTVSLAKERIVGEADPNALLHSFPNIEDLDLSSNLICKWKNALDICLQLANLRILNLSYTLFHEQESLSPYRNWLNKLQELCLNHCELTWTEVVEFSQIWPNLKILSVGYNNISMIDCLPICDQIHELNLEGNPLNGWNSVKLLGDLDCLKSLNLSNTLISHFPAQRSMFKKLKMLVLDNTQFSDWDDVNYLNNLASLDNLILKNNPLTMGEKEDSSRGMAIAKLQNLKYFNKCSISAKDRHDAEIDYLKRYSSEWHSLTPETRAGFIASHPRYKDIIIKYGAPDQVILTDQSLKSDLLTLHILSANQKVVKKLPKTMKIAKLYNTVTRIFKLKPGTIQLSSQSIKFPEVVIPLSNDSQDLAYYELESGDNILVQQNTL